MGRPKGSKNKTSGAPVKKGRGRPKKTESLKAKASKKKKAPSEKKPRPAQIPDIIEGKFCIGVRELDNGTKGPIIRTWTGGDFETLAGDRLPEQFPGRTQALARLQEIKDEFMDATEDCLYAQVYPLAHAVSQTYEVALEEVMPPEGADLDPNYEPRWETKLYVSLVPKGSGVKLKDAIKETRQKLEAPFEEARRDFNEFQKEVKNREKEFLHAIKQRESYLSRFDKEMKRYG